MRNPLVEILIQAFLAGVRDGFAGGTPRQRRRPSAAAQGARPARGRKSGPRPRPLADVAPPQVPPVATPAARASAQRPDAPPGNAAAPSAAAPPRREPAALPAGVVVRRLPPGPVPRRGPRRVLRRPCRVPGCPASHAGQEHEFFCVRHFHALGPEERQRLAEAWEAMRHANA